MLSPERRFASQKRQTNDNCQKKLTFGLRQRISLV